MTVLSKLFTIGAILRSFLMAKAKHKGYDTVKVLIEAGHVKTFDQIFETLPKTVVADDLGFNNRSFSNKIQKPGMLRNEEQFAIAQRIGIDRLKIVELVIAQLDKGKKK